MRKVDFLRLNKNVMVVVFRGFASQQIEGALNAVLGQGDFTDVFRQYLKPDLTAATDWPANLNSSLKSQNCTIALLERKGGFLFGTVKDEIRKQLQVLPSVTLS